MSTKPSDKETSEAGSEAHSPDPEKRKEAMATLRESQGKGPGKDEAKKDK